LRTNSQSRHSARISPHETLRHVVGVNRHANAYVERLLRAFPNASVAEQGRTLLRLMLSPSADRLFPIPVLRPLLRILRLSMRTRAALQLETLGLRGHPLLDNGRLDPAHENCVLEDLRHGERKAEFEKFRQAPS